MKKKYILLLLSTLLIITGLSSVKGVGTSLDNEAINKTITNTKSEFKKTETITLERDKTDTDNALELSKQADEKDLNKMATISQKDLIMKY